MATPHRSRSLRSSRSLRALVLPLVAVLALAACGDDDSAAPATPGGAATDDAVTEDLDEGDGAGSADGHTVTIQTFQFQPDPIVVPAGTTITFVNEDNIDHTVTAGTREDPTPEVFDGQLPEQGATFELTLDEPGTYDYFCTVHSGPGMTGVITVE
jgi:plastocyanin